MDTLQSSKRMSVAWLALGLAASAVVAGFGFALWSRNGVDMFVAMVQSGLAMCF